LSQHQKLEEQHGLQLAVRLSKIEIDRIQQLVAAGLYRSSADFLREAVRDKLESVEVVGIKEITPPKAKKLIEEYLKKHPGPSFASEIADNLGLDYSLAFRTIQKLLEEGRIRKTKT